MNFKKKSTAKITLLIITIFSLFSCNDQTEKTVSVKSAEKPQKMEANTTFDSQSIPISDKDLGKFPYLYSTAIGFVQIIFKNRVSQVIL